MMKMYYAEDNSMNYIAIRNMSIEGNDTAVINWDLSKEEVQDIIAAFEANENDTSIYACELEWKPFEEVMSSMTTYKAV